MALVSVNLRRVGFQGLRYLSSGVQDKNVTQAPSAGNKPSPPPTPQTPVGPGASKDGPYKNPEYYTYNQMSFYDIEKDMKSFRLPQPSNKK